MESWKFPARSGGLKWNESRCVDRPRKMKPVGKGKEGKKRRNKVGYLLLSSLVIGMGK